MIRYLSIVSLFIVTSCQVINPFYDEGNDLETSVDVEPFTIIETHNAFNIVLIQDNLSYIVYKGGETIFKEMSYSSNNHTLKLDYNYLNWANNLKVPMLEIHCPSINQIDLYASGTLISRKQISGEQLNLNIHGESGVNEIELKLGYNKIKFHSSGSVSGTIAFSGECPKAIYTLNGSINIQASELITQETTVAQNSLGDAHIYVENKLTATFFKSGNIYYKGAPKEIEVNYVQINNQDANGKLIKE